jgi:hypothetical protein
MKKVYHVGLVEYGYATGTGKWLFKSQRYELRVPVNGGAAVAHKVAALVDKGLIRTKGQGLDTTAFNAISRYTKV